MKKIIIISFIIFFISCNSDMVQKGMEAIKDPRLPEINIKYNGENIPSGSGSCILTGAKSDTICSEAIFTIENIGTADLELVDSPSIKIENDDLNEFIISSFPPSNILDSGRNLTFSVEFCPINPYEKNVTIVIQNNDFDENNYSFTLRGIAVPQTDFRARLRRGIAPLDVDFESLSEGNISLLEWDFNGDGTTDATGETATYSYTKSGKFSVVLTATGTGGSNYCIKTNYVTISNPAMNIIDNAFEGAVAVRAAYVDTDSYIDIVGVANSDDLNYTLVEGPLGMTLTKTGKYTLTQEGEKFIRAACNFTKDKWGNTLLEGKSRFGVLPYGWKQNQQHTRKFDAGHAKRKHGAQA